MDRQRGARVAINTDPPAAVRRALLLGWDTRRIVRRYPVTAAQVRAWRWRAQLVSTDAQIAAISKGLPVQALQVVLNDGATLKEACEAMSLSWQQVKRAHWQGAFLYPPQSRGHPNPAAWQRAARRTARALRKSLGLSMLASGMQPAEIADVLGCSPRTVRYWRSSYEPRKRANKQASQDAHADRH